MPDRYETLLGDEMPAATEEETPNQDLENTDADVDQDSAEDAPADTSDESSEDSEDAPEGEAPPSADVQADPYLKDRGDERTLPKWAKELIKEKPELAGSIKAL